VKSENFHQEFTDMELKIKATPIFSFAKGWKSILSIEKKH